MKHNTLSLSLLLSAALAVPTLAMAELIDYNEAPATADASTMPVEEAVQEGTDLTTNQPNVDSINQPDVNNGYEAKNGAMEANNQELEQSNAEEYPLVTAPTDYAAPQDPEVENPVAEDDFQ